jgi:hypothetical protein
MMINNIEWFDRSPCKEDLTRWLRDKKGFLNAICVSEDDPVETSDILTFIQSRAGMPILTALFDRGVECMASAVLEQLITSSGKREAFADYFSYESSLRSEFPAFNAHMGIGIGSVSRKDMTFSNIEQKLVLDARTLVAAQIAYKETQIDNLLYHFTTGTRKVLEDLGQLLFVIRFSGDGFEAVDSAVRNWFLRFFCASMARVPGIRLCVLNVGSVDLFEDLHKGDRVLVPSRMGLEDIIEGTSQCIDTFVTKERAEEFCRGAVDTNGQVRYNDFKRKLIWRSKQST